MCSDMVKDDGEIKTERGENEAKYFKKSRKMKRAQIKEDKINKLTRDERQKFINKN